MQLEDLLKKIEKRRDKKAKNFYASIDDLSDDVYKVLIACKRNNDIVLKIKKAYKEYQSHLNLHEFFRLLLGFLDEVENE